MHTFIVPIHLFGCQGLKFQTDKVKTIDISYEITENGLSQKKNYKKMRTAT